MKLDNKDDDDVKIDNEWRWWWWWWWNWDFRKLNELFISFSIYSTIKAIWKSCLLQQPIRKQNTCLDNNDDDDKEGCMIYLQLWYWVCIHFLSRIDMSWHTLATPTAIMKLYYIILYNKGVDGKTLYHVILAVNTYHWICALFYNTVQLIQQFF